VATASSGSAEAKELITGKIIRGFRERPSLLFHVMNRSGRIPVRTPTGLYVGSQPVFAFDRPRIQSVVEKVVRGLHFHHFNRRLPARTCVYDFRLNPPVEPSAICALPLFNIGDGSVFSYRFHKLRANSWLWFLMFFNRTLIVVPTGPNKPLKERRAHQNARAS
jgi:hypothetical protein